MTRSRILRRESGFTLVELLVASILMSLVLGGVYTLFSGTFSSWRGAEDDVIAYRDARIALGLMRRELSAVAPGAGHLTVGESDSFSFLALTNPLNVELGEMPRLLWITYRMERERNTDMPSLVREESPVIGPIPRPIFSNDGRFAEDLEIGKTESFVLLRGLDHLDFTYIWKNTADASLAEATPKLLEYKVVTGTWPEGIRVRVGGSQRSPDTVSVADYFETTVAYRGEAGPPPGEEADAPSSEEEASQI